MEYLVEEVLQDTQECREIMDWMEREVMMELVVNLEDLEQDLLDYLGQQDRLEDLEKLDLLGQMEDIPCL